MGARCLLLGFVARLEGDPPMSERERFIVTESSGYPIGPTGQTSPKQPMQTEVMVLDRAYCHHVVWSSVTTIMPRLYRWLGLNKKGERKRWRTKLQHATAKQWPLEKSRAYAADLAARWNSEDEQESR